MVILIFLYGCAGPKLDFNSGLDKIKELDKTYDTDIKSPPDNIPDTEALLNDLNELKKSSASDALNMLIEFRTNFLEAERLNALGWQWGNSGTTEFGFGCIKGYPKVMDSTELRISAAEKGSVAVGILKDFIEGYPNEAKSLGLSQKDVLLLNAEYFQIKEKAEKDRRLIQVACKKEEGE